MSTRTQKKNRAFLVLLSLALLFSACQTGSLPQSSTAEADQPSPLENIPAATVTPVASPEPLSLYLSDLLPDEIIGPAILTDYVLTEHAELANLWFGPSYNAPEGETLTSSTWVYALAAPFPTLTDEVSLSDLKAYWQGNDNNLLAAVEKLYVPLTIAADWRERWDSPADRIAIFSDSPPEAEVLWEENAWAILPFDKLEPKLKVISVDQVSPLARSFPADAAPLTVEFQLVATENEKRLPSEAGLQALQAAITPTNRDPDKLTTLVMTGVTALVRMTAYKMEMNGVLYPAEKIVHWLTEADLTHISNEVSFYEDCPFPDPNSRMLFFCSNPAYIELLDHVGADIIELTGNHNNDAWYLYGEDAIPFTLDLYNAHGMAYYGGGLNLEEAMTPLTITHNGNRLAFIGCNLPGPDFAWATESQGGAAPCEDFEWMADEVRRLKAEGYLPIATYQYYEDYYFFASEHHIRDYGRMAEAGAVIVNGSQAHHPKAMAFEHDAFIDYGLGNLFFDQMVYTDMYGNNLTEVRWEIIQRHTFYDGQHLSVQLLTAMLEDYAQPRPMTKEERQIFLQELFSASGWNSR